MNSEPARKPKRLWWLGAGLGVVLLAAGATWVLLKPSGPDQISPITPTSPQLTTGNVQLYWLNPEGTGLVMQPTSLTKTSVTQTPEILLTAGLVELLSGPGGTQASTTIPTGTKLRSLIITPEGIRVDLSQDFLQGGGSTAMQGRLAQVLFTVTSLNPDAPVWFSVEGQPLTVLGGEGLEVQQPITRAEFTQAFPLKTQP